MAFGGRITGDLAKHMQALHPSMVLDSRASGLRRAEV